MRANLSLGVATLFLMNLCAGTARAVDFNIPFSATGLHPNVTKVEIGCGLNDENGVSVGYKSVWVPISGGGYSGPPISISVPHSGVSSAKNWVCEVFLLEDVNGAKCQPSAGAYAQYGFCKMAPGIDANGVVQTIVSVHDDF